MRCSSPPPFFSVIIPAWKRLALLREALISVTAQTCGDYELIIVCDTASPTYFKAVTRLCADQEKPARVLRSAHTGRPGALRNMGALYAKGSWLAFLDSDDLWKPEKLQKQRALILSKPSAALVHTREIWLRQGKVISQHKQRFAREGDVFKDALKKCTIGPSTVAIKRDLFLASGGFSPSLEVAEDYELWLRLTSLWEVSYIDEPLVIKRAGLEGQEQLSQKYRQIEIFRIKALEHFIRGQGLLGEKRELAKQELKRKKWIYAQGRAKREVGPPGLEPGTT